MKDYERLWPIGLRAIMLTQAAAIVLFLVARLWVPAIILAGGLGIVTVQAIAGAFRTLAWRTRMERCNPTGQPRSWERR